MEMEMVQAVFQAAKAVYKIVDKVQQFKHRSQRLKKRIENLMPAVEVLANSMKAVPDSARTQEGLKTFSKSLGDLRQLLQRIETFLESLQKKKVYQKVVSSSSIDRDFAGYNDELACLSDALQLNIDVEMREVNYANYEDQEDQKKDLAELKDQFQKDHTDIMKKLDRMEKKLENVSSLNKQDGTSDGLQKIDRKDLLKGKKIATGRFCDTYTAEYMFQKVAYKAYKFGDNQNLKEILVREAKNLLKLNSPYIVRLWGVCIDDTEVNQLLVFEYMANGNLRAVLDKFRSDLDNLPVKRRIQMALDGAIGLNRLHNMKRPLVHRDLASDTFLVDADWKVKISGVGFAETQSTILRESKPRETGRSTVNYLPPERLENCHLKPVPHMDVYSFGIVLYEIASGAKPYKGMTDMQIRQFVLKDKEKLPVPEWNPNDFIKLIDDCRDFDPECRPVANDIVNRLREIRGSVEDKDI